MNPAWLLPFAAPAVLDAFYRLVLLGSSRRWQPRAAGDGPAPRWLVLVPARAEGTALEPTLQSITAATGAASVRTVVLLDGDDPVAVELAAAHGAAVVAKRPAGPSKAAALAWFAQHGGELLAGADAVLVLDVGSELDEEFFTRFVLADGADGVQAFLRGVGNGPGTAAALSENIAQRREDCGREALGWTVRLRGTGYALRSDVFRTTAVSLSTQVDDLELSMLLAARGCRLVMAPREAVVRDHKPHHVSGAARQRARWLVGQLTIPFRHPLALLRLLGRRPFEALGFVSEVGARPLSLTVPLRVVLGGAVILWPQPGAAPPAAVVAGALLLVSALSDVALHAAAGRGHVGSVLGLAASWLAAIVLLPRALVSWLWARRP